MSFLVIRLCRAGLKQTTSYDPAETPAEWIPSLEDELLDRLKCAESLFWTKLRTKDMELASLLRVAGEQFNGPLTEYGLARLHLGGEFGDQITDILSLTECSAISEILRTAQICRCSRRKSIRSSMLKKVRRRPPKEVPRLEALDAPRTAASRILNQIYR